MTGLKKSLIIFTASAFVSIITLLYVGMAFNKSNRPSNVPYELFPIIIPILYGIFGLINHFITDKYGDHLSLFVGAAFGLLLSFMGRFALDLPRKIFGFTQKNACLVHFYAVILYALIFRFLITPLTNYII
jgi:hypothetical protein